MQSVKAITKQIEDSQTLKLLASAYSDVAGSKLRTIRSTIERNRQFVAELATVFHIIKIAAEKQKVFVQRKKMGTANVVLTSNHRFYGGLENRLMDFFSAHMALSHGDNFVIGQTGKTVMEKSLATEKFKSSVFKKDLPTSEELNLLTNSLLGYEKVLIYHTRMQSVLLQRPVITEVGGLADISADIDPRLSYYIFEPEIEKMVDFFDQQITKVLIEQSFLEAELARTAARLVSMEQAQRNSDSAIGRQNKLLVRAQSDLANVRMLEIVMGVVGRKQYGQR